MNNIFNNKEILILGGTGTLGKALVRELQNYPVKGIRIFSRGELEQAKMKRQFADFPVPISFLIGDVKNLQRLQLAMRGVDYVINAAAMKHIDICEYNPVEALETNVDGARNIIFASIISGVEKVVHASTDKAVYPINLYGATKAVAEKLFIHGNTYTRPRNPIFSCVRYGNVMGSRGSVIGLFREQYKKHGKVFITHPDMTRFFIKISDAAKLVLYALENMQGGEIFVPELKSINIRDLACIITKDSSYYNQFIMGIRPGEKIHECIISGEETLFMKLKNNTYTILSPIFNKQIYDSGCESFYSNTANSLTKSEIEEMIQEYEENEKYNI